MISANNTFRDSFNANRSQSSKKLLGTNNKEDECRADGNKAIRTNALENEQKHKIAYKIERNGNYKAKMTDRELNKNEPWKENKIEKLEQNNVKIDTWNIKTIIGKKKKY